MKERIKAFTVVDPVTGCWEWQRYCKVEGYGTTNYKGKRYYHVHRASYEEFVGPVPDDMKVCHRCDNRKCCNPEHLFLGSMGVNMRDRDQKGRTAKGSNIKSARLTEADIPIIRAKTAAGVPRKQIAAEHGVSTDTIKGIVTGRYWKHVA